MPSSSSPFSSPTKLDQAARELELEIERAQHQSYQPSSSSLSPTFRFPPFPTSPSDSRGSGSVRREDKSTEESSGAGRSGFGSGPSGSGRRASSSSSGRRGGGHEDEGIEMQDRSTPPLPSPAFPSSADKHLSLRTMLNNAPAPLEYQLPSPPSSNKRTPTKDHLKYRSFQPVDCYEHVQLPAQLSYDLEAQPVLHASMTPPTTAYGDGWAGGGNVHDRTASGSAALLPSRPSYSSHTTSTTSLSDDSDALHPDLSPRRQPKPAPPPASAFLAFLDAGPPSPSHHYPPPPARRKSSPKILTTKLSSPPSNRRPSQPLPSSSSKHAALSSTDRLNDFGLSPSSSPQTSPPSMNSRLPLFSFLSVRGKNPAKSSDALRRPSATSVLSNEGPGGEANRPMESNRSHGTWKKGRGKGGNASVEQLGMYEMSSAVGVGKARTAEQEKQSVAEWKEWARSVAKEESKPPSSASSLYRRNASTPNIHAPSPRSPSVTIPPLPTVPAIFSPPSPHSRHLLRQSSSSIPSAAQLVQEGIISASHLPPSALPPNPLPPPALPDSRKASLAGSSSGARRKSGAAPESLTASAAPSDRGSPAYSLNPLPLPPHRTSSSTLPSLAWTSTSLAPSTQSTAPSTPEPAPPTPLAPPLLSIPSTLTSLPFSSALMARAATYPLPNTMSQSVHQSSSPFTPYRSRLSVPAVQTLLVELLGTLDLFRDAWLLLQQQQKQQQQQSHSRTSSVNPPHPSLSSHQRDLHFYKTEIRAVVFEISEILPPFALAMKQGVVGGYGPLSRFSGDEDRDCGGEEGEKMFLGWGLGRGEKIGEGSWWVERVVKDLREVVVAAREREGSEDSSGGGLGVELDEEIRSVGEREVEVGESMEEREAREKEEARGRREREERELKEEGKRRFEAWKAGKGVQGFGVL